MASGLLKQWQHPAFGHRDSTCHSDPVEVQSFKLAAPSPWASGQQSHNSQMLPEVPSLSLTCAYIVSVFCSNYPSGTITIHTYHSERQRDAEAVWSSASIRRTRGESTRHHPNVLRLLLGHPTVRHGTVQAMAAPSLRALG